MNEISMAVLLILLTVAAWCDVTSYRIPNLLIGIGLVVGLLIRLSFGGVTELLPGLQGLLVGIAVLLPLYLLRGMGAGDVKLMGLVGVFLGPLHVLGALFGTLLVGGVLSLLFAMHIKKLNILLANVKQMMVGAAFKLLVRQMPTLEANAVSAGKLPYGLAIGLGTALYLIWQQRYL